MSSTATLTEEQRIFVMELAQKTVIGVTNARLRGDINDSTLVIQSYCEEVMRATECDLGTAWAMLFSSTLANFSDAIVDLARLRHLSPEAMLSEWAISFELASMP